MMNTNHVDDTIDCRELATRYFGQPAQRAGRAWQWYCTFHADRKTPSFTAYANGYHCFGCGSHGSTVSLVMAMELMDYPAAVRYLAGVATVAPAHPPRPVPFEKREVGDEAWRYMGSN
jgi:DNA primase